MAAEQLSEGEAEIYGLTEIPVTVDGFLRRIFNCAGLQRAQVYIPTEDIQIGSFHVVVVPRQLVRVPLRLRGAKV